VEGVAPSWTPYIANNMTNDDFIPEGDVDNGARHTAEDVNVVGNNFFETMGIPMVSGRNFGAEDTRSSERVAIINRALAKKRFPNVNPIGKRFQTSAGISELNPDAHDWVRIVGVCGNTRYMNLRDDAPPQFFMPYVQQSEVGGMTYAIRTQLDPAQLLPGLRQIVQKVDRDLPIIDYRTQQEQIDANIQIERTFAALTVGFGVLALTLACVGIYGVMAYTVANRRNEIGIRLALGAQPGQVRAMILRESTWITSIGVVAGATGALLLIRLARTMLYGVAFYDPATLAVCVALLLAVALAASWIPARRAAGVQPMEALRHE